MSMGINSLIRDLQFVKSKISSIRTTAIFVYICSVDLYVIKNMKMHSNLWTVYSHEDMDMTDYIATEKKDLSHL